MSERGAAIVIIGGGVTGLSSAWWLAREGHDVLVIDKGIVGWEASGRNGGGCTHFQSPLFREEQRLWPQMDELLGYPTEYRRERIVIGLDEQQLARAQRTARGGAGFGFTYDELDPHQVRALVPLAGACVGGVYLHFGGQANPQRTVQAYAWAAQDHSARIMQHTAVTGIEERGGRVVGIETNAGRFGCEALVIAAGPQTDALLAMLGQRLPLAPARAEMIVTEPLELMAVGGVDGNGLYGRQTLRGNLAYGGGPHEWIDALPLYGALPRPGSPLVGNLAARLAALFPRAAHARVIRSWAGLIENTPDGRPVLERLDEPENVTVATMSSVGFGLSPATGHAIRDLVIDGRCSFADLEKLRLSRFANLAADWRERRGWVAPEAA